MPDDPSTVALRAWASLLDTATARPLPTVTNPVWRVRSGTGPDHLLKQLPTYPPGVEPVTEYRVLQHLQAAGVPVALPVLTDHGTLWASVDDTKFVLLPFVESDGAHPAVPSREVAEAVGAATGRLDRALAGYPRPVPSFVDDPVATLDAALPDLTPEAVQLVRPWLDRLRDATAGLPTQLTHGDCHAGNVLLADGEVVCFLDLDHLPVAPRIRDLAYYLAHRVRDALAPDAEPSPTAFAETTGAMISGFARELPLTDHERDAVVLMIMVTVVGGAHWNLVGWTPDPQAYQQNLAILRWLTSHGETIMERQQAAAR